MHRSEFSKTILFEGGYGAEEYQRMKEIMDACSAIRKKIIYAKDDLDSVYNSFFVQAKGYIESGIVLNGVAFGSERFNEYENEIKKLQEKLSSLDDKCAEIMNSLYQ